MIRSDQQQAGSDNTKYIRANKSLYFHKWTANSAESEGISGIKRDSKCSLKSAQFKVSVKSGVCGPQR